MKRRATLSASRRTKEQAEASGEPPSAHGPPPPPRCRLQPLLCLGGSGGRAERAEARPLRPRLLPPPPTQVCCGPAWAGRPAAELRAVTCQGHSPSSQFLPPTMRIRWLSSSLELGSVPLRPSRWRELSVGPRSPRSYCSGTPASGASPLPWAADRLPRPRVTFPQGKGSGRRAVGPQPRGGLPAGPTQATPRRSPRSGPWGSGAPCVLLGLGCGWEP